MEELIPFLKASGKQYSMNFACFLWLRTISAGVPQVILPVWGDTYDFAKRAEYLGIGRFGSPKYAPKVNKNELGPILKQVVLGPESVKFQKKAEELAALCSRDGGGRRTAARALLNIIEEQ